MPVPLGLIKGKGGNQPTFIRPDADAAAKTHEIRVIDREGNPWFVVKDVCHATGSYVRPSGQVNTDRALSMLADDEKGSTRIGTLGGPQIVRIISESGLYKLVMRSDKPAGRSHPRMLTRPAPSRNG